MTPANFTSTPVEATPAASADSSISPEIRVSFPIITQVNLFFCEKCPTACPVLRATSQVIGYWFATPLIPSVPKSFPTIFSCHIEIFKQSSNLIIISVIQMFHINKFLTIECSILNNHLLPFFCSSKSRL